MDPQGLESGNRYQRRSGCTGSRLILPIIILVVAFAGYFSSTQVNPVTGEKQKVALSAQQEIALGLQAAPEMIAQHKGEEDSKDAQYVRQVGKLLVAASEASKSPYKFQFHLLADPQTINAFALPGGQVFITRALYSKLETEGQLAGVLGHEIGHVVERHGAQQMAKQNLTQGIIGAVSSASDDPQSTAQLAAAVGNLVNMKYGREDELEADQWGVKISAAAGYDPHAMIGVMKILEKVAAGSRQPEFLSTHPDPGNRIEKIKAIIDETWPDGVPDGLKP